MEPKVRDPLIGQQLGNFRVERAIAEGGMGRIYQAVHTVIGRKAAIKVLTERYSQDQMMIKRLHREARAVNRIGHPYIVDIFDFGRTADNREYFVMEYLDGKSLAQYLAHREPQPWSFSSRVLTDVLDALAAAHDLRIVHRDIKPENIFIVENAGQITAKVLDFGIAKSLGLGPEGEKLTRAGSVMGTPEYIAPEQIRGRKVDGRADLYAVGIILYELLTGKRPYESTKPINLLLSHLRDPVPDPGPLAAELGVPDFVPEILARALAKDPAKRIQDARSFARALGLDVRSVSAADGTQQLPEMYWEVDASTSTKDFSQPDSTFGGLTPSVDLSTGGFTADSTMDSSLRLPPPGPARPWWQNWKIPLAIIAGSLVVMIAVKLFKTKPTAAVKPPVVATKPDPPPKPKGPQFPPIKDYRKVKFRVQGVLRQGLEAPEEAIRISAVRGVGELRDEDAASRIIHRLKFDPSPMVRNSAARTLAHIGGETSRKALETARKESGPRQQVWIADALYRLGAKTSLKQVVKLTKSKDQAVALNAALVLAEHARSRKNRILAQKKLASMLSESMDAQVMAAVLKALAQLGSRKAQKALKDGLTQQSVRLSFATALAEIGDEAATKPLKALIKRAKTDQRLIAAKGLALLGDYSGLDVLLRGVRDAAPNNQALAAMGLAIVGDAQAVPPLAFLLQSKNSQVRGVAAEALATVLTQLPEELMVSSQKMLLAALDSRDQGTRLAALDITTNMDPEAALNLISWALVSKDVQTRLRAVSMIAKLRLKNPKAIARRDRLLAKARLDKNADVRVNAGQTLFALNLRGEAGELSRQLVAAARAKPQASVNVAGSRLAQGEGKYLAQITEFAKKGTPAVRRTALRWLGRWRDPKATPILLAALKDKAADVRLEAALQLANRANKAGVAELRKAINREDSRAVEAIGGLAKLRYDQTKEIQRLASSRSGLKRQNAMRGAYTLLKADVALPLLRTGSRDRFVGVRLESAKGLSNFAGTHPAQTLGPLLSLVNDPVDLVRAAASPGVTRARRAGRPAAKKKPVKVKIVKPAPEPKLPAIAVAPPTKDPPNNPRIPQKPTPRPKKPELTDDQAYARYKKLSAQAQIAEDKGNYRRAIALLNRAIKETKRPGGLCDLGKVYVLLATRNVEKKPKKALGQLSQAERYFGRCRKGGAGRDALKKAKNGRDDIRRIRRRLE